MTSIHYRSFFAAALMASLLTGCGGGGGGDTTSSLTYTGATTAAAITGTSASPIGSSAVGVSTTAGTISTISVGVSTTPQTRPALASSLNQVINSIVHSSIQQSAPVSTGATYTGSGNLSGCGGTATASGTIENNGTPGDYSDDRLLSGSITYSNFVPYDIYGVCTSVILNGTISTSITWTGPDGVGAYYPQTISLNASNFSMTSGSLNQAINGTINVALTYNAGFSLTDKTFTMTADFRDVDGKIYRVENYQEVYNSTTGVNISGRFYHPDYGYVDLSTSTPFNMGSCSPHPETGVLTLTGTSGQWIEIDANTSNCSTYQLTWGDGTTTSAPTYPNW